MPIRCVAPDFSPGGRGFQADTAGKSICPSLGSRFKPAKRLAIEIPGL